MAKYKGRCIRDDSDHDVKVQNDFEYLIGTTRVKKVELVGP